MAPLSDHIAVVTGASSGIGRALCLSLAQAGAKVCLVGRDRGVLQAIVDSAGSPAGQLLCLQADLTVDEQVLHIGNTLKNEFGQVDVLIHSSGVITHGTIEEALVGDFDLQYRANVRAPYLLTQVLLPLLKTRPGQVVFMNSSAGLSGKPGAAQFSACQHALKAIADSLRQEVNANGIRVLSVFPGRTATFRQETLHKNEGKPYRPGLLLQPEDVAMFVVSALSLPRTAEVTDVSIRPLIKSY